mgnify:CR=1 FL=1
MLGSYCPEVLFPFAREAIAELVAKGGFPQLLLAPVNFNALYMQHQQKQAEDELRTANEANALIRRIADRDIDPGSAVRALLDERKALSNEVAQLRRELAMAGGAGQGGGAEAREVNGVKFMAQVLTGVSGKDLPPLIDEHKVTHMSGAPIVLNMMIGLSTRFFARDGKKIWSSIMKKDTVICSMKMPPKTNTIVMTARCGDRSFMISPPENRTVRPVRRSRRS